MTKANWLTGYPAAVNIRYKEQWTTFEIIDKKLKAEVQSNIAITEISNAVSEAER